MDIDKKIELDVLLNKKNEINNKTLNLILKNMILDDIHKGGIQ